MKALAQQPRRRKPRRALAIVWWVAALAGCAAAVLVAGVLVYRWVRPLVTVTAVVEGPVVAAFYATGTLSPEREYPIKSNASGYVAKVFADKGTRLKAGDPIALVVEDGVQFRYDQASADVEQKRKLADAKDSPVLREIDARIDSSLALLQIAQREEKRLRDLMETEGGTRVEWDRALDRVKTISGELEAARALRKTKEIELKKDLDVAEAALKIAQWHLDRQTIRVPESLEQAVVLERPAPVGTRVAPPNDDVTRIADIRPEKLVMRSQVDEEDIVSVRPGGKVLMTLYAYPGRAFEGKVKTIYDQADPERRTFEVDVEMVEKDPHFSAGMTGELAFVISEKQNVQVIPRQAVQGKERAVWVVRDGRLARSGAKIGIMSIERAEVLWGLAGNDRVVISPLSEPEEGQHVRTTFMDPKAAADLNRPKEEKVGMKFN